MKYLVLSVLLCVLAVNARQKAFTPTGVGYYWRDFDGSYYPSDSYDVAPNTYIGQIHAHGMLLPGTINKVTGVAEYAFQGKAYSTHNEVKIFCTTDPTQFEWVKTDYKRIHFLLPTRFFIAGGHGTSGADRTLIGRSLISSRVGGIYLYAQDNGLQYAKNDKSYLELEFEAIAFK